MISVAALKPKSDVVKILFSTYEDYVRDKNDILKRHFDDCMKAARFCMNPDVSISYNMKSDLCDFKNEIRAVHETLLEIKTTSLSNEIIIADNLLVAKSYYEEGIKFYDDCDSDNIDFSFFCMQKINLCIALVNKVEKLGSNSDEASCIIDSVFDFCIGAKKEMVNASQEALELLENLERYIGVFFKATPACEVKIEDLANVTNLSPTSSDIPESPVASSRPSSDASLVAIFDNFTAPSPIKMQSGTVDDVISNIQKLVGEIKRPGSLGFTLFSCSLSKMPQGIKELKALFKNNDNVNIDDIKAIMDRVNKRSTTFRDKTIVAPLYEKINAELKTESYSSLVKVCA